MIFVLLVVPVVLALYEWVFGYDMPVPTLFREPADDEWESTLKEIKNKSRPYI